MGRRAQGEAGGNRGRDRGRALREEEDDPDAWGRPVSGATRASGRGVLAGGAGASAAWEQAECWGGTGCWRGRAGGPVRSRDGCLGRAEREEGRGVNWARGKGEGGVGLGCWVGLLF